MMSKITISEQMIEAFKICKVGTQYKRKDIIKIVVDFCGCNPNSVIPSDYCYNRLNDGIEYEKNVHLFKYVAWNCYEYCGINYDYSGPVYHKPQKGKEYQIGKVDNGKFELI